MRLRSYVCSAALLLAGLCLHAQDVPSGWKVVKDKQGTCQFAVPPDWTTDKLAPSFANSPDGKANAVVHGVNAEQSFSEATTMAKQVMPPTKILEDTGKRLWFVYQGNGASNGATNWYIAVPGKPVCAAQVTFKVSAMEDTAKKVALSVASAK